MTKEEFNKIDDNTWIRVTPPDDPFTSREYKVLSNIKELEPDERREYYQKTTIPAHYKAYVHAIIKFTPENWAEPGYKVYFPEKTQFISDWDVHHAVIAKKVTKKTYRGTIKDLFERKKNYERR
jgi:hypothetical protein